MNIKLTVRRTDLAGWVGEIHMFLGDYVGATALQPGVTIDGKHYSVEAQVMALPPPQMMAMPSSSPDPNSGRIASALERIAGHLEVPSAVDPETGERGTLGTFITLGMHSLSRLADTTELGRDQLAEEQAADALD